MKKFPNLEVLKIYAGKNHGFNLHEYTSSTAGCTLQFLAYLINVRNVSSVSPLITNNFTADILSTFFDYPLSQKSPTWKNLEIHLKIAFDVVIPRQRLEFYRTHTTATITPLFRYRNNKKICEITVSYRGMLRNVSLSCLELFQKLGNVNIECLAIGNTTITSINRLAQKVLIPLDIIFRHLKNVKKIAIFNSRNIVLTTNRFRLKEKAKILETLEFNYSYLRRSHFPFISATCPGLKFLKINHCLFMRPYENGGYTQDMIRIVHLKMPYTRLQELYFIIWSEACPEDHSFKIATIQLKTTNNKAKYHNITLKDSSDNEGEYQQHKRAAYKNGIKNEHCLVFKFSCETVTEFLINPERPVAP